MASGKSQDRASNNGEFNNGAACGIKQRPRVCPGCHELGSSVAAYERAHRQRLGGVVVSVGRREGGGALDLISNGLDWGWRELGEGEARQRK